MARDGDQVDDALARADELILRGAVDQAAAVLLAAVERFPGSRDVHEAAVWQLLRVERFEDALVAANWLEQRFPDEMLDEFSPAAVRRAAQGDGRTEADGAGRGRTWERIGSTERGTMSRNLPLTRRAVRRRRSPRDGRAHRR